MTEATLAAPVPYRLSTVEELRACYDQPSEPVILKQIDIVDEHCRRFIGLSPFFVFATCGNRGMDCSPKGDYPGFVHVLDEHTLLIPDRPGNNRIDGLQNIIENPAVGLIFLIPGVKEALRVNGEAHVSIDPELLARFGGDAKPAKSVIVVNVREAFIHCGRAMSNAGLWEAESQDAERQLPDLMSAFKAHVAYSKAQRDCE